MIRRSCAWFCLLFWLGAVSAVAAPRRVLIIHSFGREFAPFDTMSSTFRTELARQSPEPVEFYEASIETARFAEVGNDGPLLEYLKTLLAERPPDLIVTMAEPATLFCVRHRAEFFPAAPLLAHVDWRQLPMIKSTANAVIIPVEIDIPRLIENILQVRPATKHVVLILGASPFEHYWADICRREFARYEGRLTFAYTNDLTLDQMCDQVGRLPSDSAVLYGMLAVDAAGVPYEQERALSRLRAATNAPLFGVFESHVGLGIVGGQLLSLESSGQLGAATALRIFSGTKPADLPPPVAAELRTVYDWRELQRWKIDQTLLRADSTVKFRVPTFWEQYKWRLIAIYALCIVEGLLIFALLRSRRRLLLAQRDLRQSEERLSLATNSAKVGVWSLDLQTGAIEATDECKRIFQVPPERPANLTGFIERVHPDDREPVRRAIEEAARGASNYDMQYRITLPDGTARWIAARGRGHRTDGTAGSMLGVVLDITERKQGELDVQRHRQELAHVSRVAIMGELSASIAHELNQPLTAILSNAQAAQRFMAAGAMDPEEFRAILQDVVHDTTRARDVIRHLRALVKKNEADFEWLQLDDTIREVATFLHSDIVSRNVRITLDLATGLPPVHGDRTQLQQVMINLLLNAFEAMNSFPVPDRIVHVQLERFAPRTLCVTVRDHGPGVPAEKLETIFDPFFTTKPEGMGMGLSVTRSIINAHGGRIWVENHAISGALFHFTLPVNDRS